jgi:hypothetical protein
MTFKIFGDRQKIKNQFIRGSLKLLDIFGFRNDEKIINFSISKARDFAWDQCHGTGST